MTKAKFTIQYRKNYDNLHSILMYSFINSLIPYFYRTRNRFLDRAITLSHPPVFIVGCGHSGTTLLASLLGRHSNIHLVNWETYIFRPKRSFRQIKFFFNGITTQCHDKRILEKTPRHVQDLQRIFHIFPNAQIIALVRDGRDVACSMRKRDIKLHKGMQRWVNDCQFIEKFENDSRLRIVKYEDLVTSPEDTLSSIINFLALSPETKSILSASETIEWDFAWSRDINYADEQEYTKRSRHLSRRNTQVNQPIYNDAEKWKIKLDQADLAHLNAIGQYFLYKWGYL